MKEFFPEAHVRVNTALNLMVIARQRLVVMGQERGFDPDDLSDLPSLQTTRDKIDELKSKYRYEHGMSIPVADYEQRRDAIYARFIQSEEVHSDIRLVNNMYSEQIDGLLGDTLIQVRAEPSSLTALTRLDKQGNRLARDVNRMRVIGKYAGSNALGGTIKVLETFDTLDHPSLSHDEQMHNRMARSLNMTPILEAAWQVTVFNHQLGKPTPIKWDVV